MPSNILAGAEQSRVGDVHAQDTTGMKAGQGTDSGSAAFVRGSKPLLPLTRDFDTQPKALQEGKSNLCYCFVKFLQPEYHPISQRRRAREVVDGDVDFAESWRGIVGKKSSADEAEMLLGLVEVRWHKHWDVEGLELWAGPKVEQFPVYTSNRLSASLMVLH